jgi:membrane protease YdiL (CAAX protease family)
MSLSDDTLPEYDKDDIIEDELPDFRDPNAPPLYRGASSDPMFGYLIALALAIGLTALQGEQGEQYQLRYTLVWTIMAGFGVLAWLLGSSARIVQETPENLAWGVVFGLIIATPLLAFGGSTLTTTVTLLFGTMTPGVLLAYLVFVMPLAETLFFRGVMQETRAFWVVALMSSLWGAVLFFPVINSQRAITEFPAVVVVIALALLMMNLTYSYVRRRNGLAAAWICQIVVNLVLLFFPFLSS